MCTVTFVPKENNNFILTSNRDESPTRDSIAPKFYKLDETTALFPKDKLSGGTWIGLSDKNRLVCVLNGGSIRHERLPSYRKSRGLVAKEFLATESISELQKDYNFTGIEPFTMIIVEWHDSLQLFEMILNETGNIFNKLSLKPRIWSSTTLYSDFMKKERQKWFKDFMAENKLDSKNLLKFHQSAGKGNLDYGVVMDRGLVKTTSRTQIEKSVEVIEMRYENLQTDTKSNETFRFPQIVND